MIKKAAFSLLVFLLLFGGGALYAKKYINQYRADRNRQIESLKKQDIQITFVEGWRREEFAAHLAKAGICEYQAFMTASEGKEGTLFPDTYRFFPNTEALEVVKTLTANFATKTSSLNPSENDLILASIIEREAQDDTERPIIAGVYTNRLKLNMLLQADPTVQYARDDNEVAALMPGSISTFKYWAPITQDDYKGAIGAYNTYLNTGLPPTPIANPGLKSIEAAVTPAQHDYLYFLHKNGELLLSKTLSEHQAKQ